MKDAGMRLLVTAAALAALSSSAFAQQPRPQQQPPQQQRPAQQQQQPAQQQPAQQQAEPQAPGMFACRTEQEVCYIGIVLGNNQVSVLYTTDTRAEGIDGKPVAVQGAQLGQHAGRVVMLTGTYNAQSGLSGAEVVDVASPLLSFAIKSMLSNAGQEEEEPEPAPQPQRRQPQRR
jgi:hypothetical protein